MLDPEPVTEQGDVGSELSVIHCRTAPWIATPTMTTQIRENQAKAGTETVDLVDPVRPTGASESVQHDDREAVRFAEKARRGNR